MKSTAIGTKLQVEDEVTPGTFIDVGNLTSIGVPSPTKSDIDVTDFDSEAMEFLPGLTDNGELALSGFYNNTDAGQTLMYTDANDRNAGARLFRIQFTNQAVQFEFDAYVKSFAPTAGGPNEAYTFDASLRVSGAVTKSAIA